MDELQQRIDAAKSARSRGPNAVRTPEEWAAYEREQAQLKAEAKAEGLRHAARGKKPK
jgi:hypothetical protein